MHPGPFWTCTILTKTKLLRTCQCVHVFAPFMHAMHVLQLCYTLSELPPSCLPVSAAAGAGHPGLVPV